MSLPSEADAQLPLKKRARRRLVGAIALAVLAAVVLPMVMDQAPQTPVADVQIRIPGQDQLPAFAARAPDARASDAAKATAAKPEAVAAPAALATPGRVDVPARTETPAKSERAAEKAAPADKPVAEKPAAEKAAEKAAARPAEKPAATDKPAEKAREKAVEKPVVSPAEKAKAEDEVRRVAAILSGKGTEAPAATSAASNGQYIVLIGAFANPANVKQLQTKLGEIGVKTFTEPLDSPQGKKTRVRAGPFPNRDAAEKALEKMKRIGVGGVVAAKQ